MTGHKRSKQSKRAADRRYHGVDAEARIRRPAEEAEEILGKGTDEDVRSAAASDGTGVSGNVSPEQQQPQGM